MDRPALKQLLEDITAGRVDTVVVYKIDRLTRSLADFAKIVEILDARGASFVSVTQQFNTTTSMGRLTLNIPYLFEFAYLIFHPTRRGRPTAAVAGNRVERTNDRAWRARVAAWGLTPVPVRER